MKKSKIIIILIILLSFFIYPSVDIRAKERPIIIAQKGDVTAIDPHMHNDVDAAPITRSIFETLVKLNNETMEFENWLAKEINYEDDVTVNVELREGIEFSNGIELTSEDVKFSLERQKEYGRVSHLVEMIKDVEIVDDYNFVIHLSEPSSALLSSLSHMGSSILCKEIVEPLDEEGEQMTTPEEIIGTGPFTFESWVLGSEVVLGKNENYWNKEREAQSVGLVLKIIPEDTSRIVALETGEVDVLLSVPTIEVNALMDNEDIKLIEYETTALNAIVFNVSKPPFDNKALREAVAHCIDRQAMIQVQFNGRAVECHSCIANAALGYTPDVKQYEHSIEKAKEKLAEAGFPDGFTFSVLVRDADQARGMQVLQASCLEAGIVMEIEQVEPAFYFDQTGKGLHEACHLGWVANAEPDNTFRPFFSKAMVKAGGANRSCFWDPEVEKLLEIGSTTADYAEKIESYQEISKIAAEECVVIGYCSPLGYIAMQSNVDGFIESSIEMHDYYGLHFVDEKE